MKKTTLYLCVIFFLGNSLQAQELCSLIKEASVSNCQGNYEKTETALRELIEHFPNHNLASEFKLSLGQALFYNGKYEESKELLLKLMEQIPDTTDHNYKLIACPTSYDDNISDSQFGCLRIVFPETNNDIKHDALLILSNIAVIKKDPLTSIEYLKLAKTKYLKNSDCGNGINMIQGYLAIKLAKSYLMNNDTLRALQELLPEISNWDADYEEIRDLCKLCVSSLYSDQELDDIIEETVNSLEIKETETSGRIYKLLSYRFLDKKINFRGYYDQVNLEALPDLKLKLQEQLTSALKE